MLDTEAKEARSERRIVSLYKTCCVAVGDQVRFALLRNYSDGGAQIEGEIDAPVGARVYYMPEEGVRIEAEIRWKDGARVGLANRSVETPQGRRYPNRPLRLPMVRDAIAWIDGTRFAVRIANISQRGARLIGLPRLPVGKLIVLKVGTFEIQSVTARWTGDVATGVRFPRPLPLTSLNRLLSAEQACSPSAITAQN